MDSKKDENISNVVHSKKTVEKKSQRLIEKDVFNPAEHKKFSAWVVKHETELFSFESKD